MRTRMNIRKNEAGAATTEPTASTGETTAPPTPETTPAASASTDTTPPTGAAGAEATPNTPSMDELASRVAEAEKGLASSHKSFTAAEFAVYVNEQLELAKAEDAEKAGARFKALQAAIGLAKTAFESSASASIPVYHDPWQTDATTKSIASPTGVSSGTSNIGYPVNVDTAKRMLVIAKELRKPDSELAKALDTKVEKSSSFAPVAKAGEAAGILEKIASLFGVNATNDVGDYRGLAWRVEDVIRALESAAAMDKALAAMSAAFGGLAPAATAEPEMPEAGEVEAAAKSVTKSSTTTSKEEDNFASLGATTNVDGWPIDMNATPRITKSASKKATEEEIRF